MSLERFLIDCSDFEVEKEIGKGSFGIVFLCHPRNNKETKIAMKSITSNYYDKQTQKYFIREISIMANLNHPNLLKLVGFSIPSKKSNNFIIYSKYIPNKTLSDVLKEDKLNDSDDKILTPTILSKIVYGIASSVQYLHQQKVVHRDLKPENVFLDEDFNPILSDFGLSRFTNDVFEMTTRVGTPYYMAPEMFDEEVASTNKIDVYAFGVTLLKLFTVKLKFNESKPKSINLFFDFIKRGNRYKIPKRVPEFYVSLINRCWSHSPNKRPSFDEIVKDLEKNDDFMFKGSDADEVHKYIYKLKKSKIYLKVEDEIDEAGEILSPTKEFDFGFI